MIEVVDFGQEVPSTVRLNCYFMSRSDFDSDSKDSRREKFKSKKNWTKETRDDENYLSHQANKSHKKEIKKRKESMIEDEIWEDWEEYNK